MAIYFLFVSSAGLISLYFFAAYLQMYGFKLS